MKKTILLMILVSSFVMNQNIFGQATDLIISEYIEGTSNNKALEVFNGTGATLDMTQYRFTRSNNGATVVQDSLVLTGTLADGAVFVIANPNATAAILAVADVTSTITYYNGNDYIGLEKFVTDTWVTIDVIGVLGENPPSGAWDVAGVTNATNEQTLVRKADICSPQINWATSAGTNTTDSEWIVYNQDDFNYIGNHTSTCTGPPALNANFTADNQLIYPGETVTFSDLTIGGTPPYTLEWDLDGDNVYESTGTNPQFTYSSVGKYTVRLRVTDDVSTIDIEEKIDFISATNPLVANLSELRAGDIGQEYTITGEVILTFQQTYRNQKYIQDATAAIMIDDFPGVITSIYSLYDGITGIIGTLDEYGNMLQFIPNSDPGVATSSGNIIIPQVVTINDLNNAFDDFESELVQLLGVTYTDAGATFTTGIVYPISDGSKALGNFRTNFYDADYIGTIIPTTADIVVLPNAKFDGNYVTSRFLADIQGQSNPATQLAIVSINGGVNPYANEDFSVVVQAQDALGDPGYITGDVSFTFKTNGGDLGTVQFVGGTTTSGTILDGTNQVTLTGVQMAPIGTNVTITAEDDLIFGGLLPGTSSPFDVIELIIPELIITEVMQNPSAVSDTDGEWFEIYNYGLTDVDLLNFVIKDNGSDSTTIDLSVNVPAGGFVVLGRNSDPSFNGDYTCNYQYTGFLLGNGDDEIVLTLPDGLTEIDRVEWDGGPVWPDPTGTSMTFHGFPTDDNNDGTNWTYATFREASFVGPGGDRGTPGSNGYDQILTGGFKLDLKVLLEGPYNAVNDSMTNNLRAQGFIPADQPFNPTLPYYGNLNPVWLYGGSETNSYFPFYGTDWILVELRDATSAGTAGSGTMIAQYPAYLMVDGQVVSLNGSTPLNINLTYSNSLYIVIWHRNHLGIMTASGLNPFDDTIESYDFSTGSGQVHNGAAGYIELEPGIWGMVAGDVDAEGNVDGSDKADGWGSDTGKAGYLGGDLDLNGQSNNEDKNDIWLLNNGTSSQVPN